MRRMRAVTLVALVTLACAMVWAWGRGMYLPGWVHWKSGVINCGEEEAAGKRMMVLEGKSLCLLSGETVVWRTGRELLAQDALWCDIDHDGQNEVLLLCWRRGRYGSSHPFWAGREETNWSQHIFIYDWTEAGVRPAWMASDIGMEAVDWRFDEKERLLITDAKGRTSAWAWSSWGLQLIAAPER